MPTDPDKLLEAAHTRVVEYLIENAAYIEDSLSQHPEYANEFATAIIGLACDPATIRAAATRSRERDELRAAAEVVNSAFAVGWPDGGWQMTPKRIAALNALEYALHRKDGASDE